MQPVFELYDYLLLKTGFTANYPLYDELALLLTTSGSTIKSDKQMLERLGRNAQPDYSGGCAPGKKQ